MEGLNWLCNCCMNDNCENKKIEINEKNECKTIKCLNYTKDNSKIEPYVSINYRIRSEEL